MFAAASLQLGQARLHLCGDAPVAGELGRAVARQEGGVVGRLGGVGGIVEVQRRVAPVRRRLVGDGGVELAGQQVMAAAVGGHQHQGVGGDQFGVGQGCRLARGGRDDAPLLGLGLQSGHDRAAAAPAEQDDLLVALAFARVAHHRGEVEQHVLHLQRRVAVPIA